MQNFIGVLSLYRYCLGTTSTSNSEIFQVTDLLGSIHRQNLTLHRSLLHLHIFLDYFIRSLTILLVYMVFRDKNSGFGLVKCHIYLWHHINNTSSRDCNSAVIHASCETAKSTIVELAIRHQVYKNNCYLTLICNA